MKFRGITLAVMICFTFYSICGCTGTKNAMSDMDKYHSMPYQDVFVAHAGYDAAYKATIVSLEKKGYILTLSDSKTGMANLERATSSKLPEEEKKEQMDNSGPSIGTVILVALSIILVVGLIVMIASSDDDSKEKKDEHKNDSQVRTGRIGGSQSSRAVTQISPQTNERHEGGYNYIGPLINTATAVSSSYPPTTRGYLYVLTVNASALSDSTTEIRVSTNRMDLINGYAINSENFENKYLNYTIFEGISTELGRK